MTQETGDLIITITVIVGVLIIIAALIYSIKVGEKEEALRRQKVLEEYEKEPEYKFVNARVLSRRKTVYYQTELRMPTLPAQKLECIVTFLTEEGKTLEFYVREEIFDRIQENQEGMLVTVNGNFFDFGDGEDLEEETVQTIKE